MHAKTDSEVTSLAASSPTRSPPRRPLYYVQSPSRDSHDGEKTATTSFHSTPVLSPVASPPHSRHSSSTRFSKKDHSHSLKPWKQIDVIEEEGLLQGDDRRNGLSRRCYFLAFVVGFLLLFSLFSLILWGASRPMKPKISVKVYFRFVSASLFLGGLILGLSFSGWMLRWGLIKFEFLGWSLRWVVVKFSFLQWNMNWGLMIFNFVMKHEVCSGQFRVFRMKSELGLTRF